MEQIAIIGVGYVGLVAAASFAHVGHKVICIDIDEKKVTSLKNGQVPFYEPGLEPLVVEGIAHKLLSFSTSYKEALNHTSYIVLAVDTPMQDNGSCNTTNIFRAAASIAEHMTQDALVIVKSTVPVGTCAALLSEIQKGLKQRNVNFHVNIVSNPEFLKEGAAVQDFMRPDRIILGVTSERAEEMMRRLYAPFGHLAHKFVVMDLFSSEMTKYASNTMLALRISFMNWLSQLCEKTGADIDSVRLGMGADKRIGPAFLRSGVGFGGSCFPKDIQALGFLAEANQCDASLIGVIDTINEEQKNRFADQIIAYVANTPATVAILGLSFKPGTDDMRKAPSLTIIRKLLQHNISLRVYDPVAINTAKEALLPHEVEALTWCSSVEDASQGADALALVTEWPEFSITPLKVLKKHMKGNGLFDGRSFYTALEAEQAGFDYICLGKAPLYINKTQNDLVHSQ